MCFSAIGTGYMSLVLTGRGLMICKGKRKFRCRSVRSKFSTEVDILKTIPLFPWGIPTEMISVPFAEPRPPTRRADRDNYGILV